MRVIVMSKGSLAVAEFNSVTSIAFSSGTVVITYGSGSTASYTYADVLVQIIP